VTEPVPVVDPSELSGYLASRGWHREGSWRGAGVWELDPAGRLLVPDRREYPDDGELLQEAVRKLAGYEERPERELLLDITEPMVDSQYFRTYPETPPGTAPLLSGVRAVQAVHNLMRTAALTAEEGPRMFFKRRRSAAVESFMHRIVLGSAQTGSYVLTTRVPVATSDHPQLALWESATPPAPRPEVAGRTALARLFQAVTAAHAAAVLVIDQRVTRGQERLDVFDESVEEGVSGNLCKALADLGGHSRDKPFEIGFSWARGLPSREPEGPVAFTGAMAGVLARAGDELERLADSGSARITGIVETLDMRAGSEPRIKVVGDFRIGKREAYHRGLWVIVSRSQYDQAYEAQQAGWLVDAEGRMVTANRRREMRPGRFDIHRQ
jgi:hypothetical protein